MLIGIDFDKFSDIKTCLQFIQKLANEFSVFVLPSECFSYQGYFRIVVTSTEQMLEEASDRIIKFCANHYC